MPAAIATRPALATLAAGDSHGVAAACVAGWGARRLDLVRRPRRRCFLGLERRDGDLRRARTPRELHGRRPRAAARRLGRYGVRAGIDGDGHAPLGAAEEHAVATHLEVLRLRGDGDGQARQLRLELRRPFARDALALVVPRGGGARRFFEHHPGARGAVAVLVAVTEPKHRADAGVEPLALGELGARLGELPLLDQRPPLLEQDLGRRPLLRGRGVVGTGARRGERERDRERSAQRLRSATHSRSPNCARLPPPDEGAGAVAAGLGADAACGRAALGRGGTISAGPALCGSAAPSPRDGGRAGALDATRVGTIAAPAAAAATGAGGGTGAAAGASDGLSIEAPSAGDAAGATDERSGAAALTAAVAGPKRSASASTVPALAATPTPARSAQRPMRAGARTLTVVTARASVVTDGGVNAGSGRRFSVPGSGVGGRMLSPAR